MVRLSTSKQVGKLKRKNHINAKEIDDLDQYGRHEMIEISGIPFKDDKICLTKLKKQELNFKFIWTRKSSISLCKNDKAPI